MSKLIFITHANILMNKNIPVPDWHLSELGCLRHIKFNQNKILSNIDLVFSSNEQKAIDGAKILSSFLKVDHLIEEDLHENDRSSTGFLPPEEFQKTANLFFKNSETSIRGWEKAIDAQERIFNCTVSILNKQKNLKDIAIVSHGGVGTLLLCKLLNILKINNCTAEIINLSIFKI